MAELWMVCVCKWHVTVADVHILHWQHHLAWRKSLIGLLSHCGLILALKAELVCTSLSSLLKKKRHRWEMNDRTFFQNSCKRGKSHQHKLLSCSKLINDKCSWCMTDCCRSHILNCQLILFNISYCVTWRNCEYVTGAWLTVADICMLLTANSHCCT